MATTNLNTRISLKYDSFANWTANNPVLLKGEVAIVVIPAETGAMPQEPAVLMKIGDGVLPFNELPFASAKAADIYSWAKASTKPTYSAEEITGLSDYISGEIQDTDTQYKLEQDANDGHVLKLFSKTLGGDWTLVTTITTVDTVYDDTALAGRVSAVETLVGSTAVATQIANAIAALKLDETYDAKGSAAAALADAKTYADGKDAAIAAAKKAGDDAQASLNAYKTSNDAAVAAVNTKIGTVPEGKTVAQMIADAQDAATYDDTQVKADIAANKTAIDLLNGASTVAGSVDYKIAQAVAAIMENPDETMNSINELVTWINGHAQDALELSNKVEDNAADIAALEALVGSEAVATQITNAIAAALKIDGVDKYALATDLTAAIGRIAALEAKAHEHANKTVLDGITAEKVGAWDAAESNAKSYVDQELKDLGFVEGDSMANFVKKADAPGYADILTKTSAATLYEAKGAAKAAVEALDKADAAVAKQFVTAVSETNGLVEVTRRALTAEDVPALEIAKITGLQTALDAKANDADLAAIAKTGNVNDLVQTAGDVLILNCGTSSTVI